MGQVDEDCIREWKVLIECRCYGIRASLGSRLLQADTQMRYDAIYLDRVELPSVSSLENLLLNANTTMSCL